MTIRQMIRTIRGAAALAGLVAMSAAASAADKAHVRVLILTGANNHDWRQTTPVLKSLFEGDERFTVVEVVENPSSLTAASFARCDVVVSNWSAYPAMTGRQWGREAEEAFIDFVRSGKGFVAFHAASATSQDWPEFQQLVGLTWGLEKTGHGSLGPLRVTIADKDHPITKGMVDFWTVDELWHNMVAIAKPEYRILCTAFSRLDQRGSGKYEPALICTQLGKGRGVNLILGHDVAAMRNVGWRTLMLRSAEWAATGATTVPIPADWPTTSLAAIATNLDADAVLKDAAAYRFGQSRQALLAVEQLVMYASSLQDSAGREKLAARLAEPLASNAAPEAKSFFCTQLANIGTPRQVPAIAPLLLDESTSDAARFALERIAGPEAARALRDAAARATGRLRVGIVNSIGNRADAEAVGLLAPLASDADPALADSAVSALGKIGTEPAAKALADIAATAPPARRDAVADASLCCAERLAATNNREAAAELCRRWADPSQPERIRTAAGRLLDRLK